MDTAVAAPSLEMQTLPRARPLIRCSWDQVLMIHYAIPPAILEPVVPFVLDTHDGLAYVSLVAFEMSAMRTGMLGGLLARVPLFPRHRFLNLRTYVRHGSQPAIYFLAEWVSNPLAVALGPLLYGLPYRRARIDYHHAQAHEAIHGTVAAEGALTYVATVGGAPCGSCARGGLDEFLMERYVAFTERRGIARRFDVTHEPWRQSRADVSLTDDTLVLAAADWFRHARLAGANYSPGVRDVVISAPSRVNIEHRTERSFS